MAWARTPSLSNARLIFQTLEFSQVSIHAAELRLVVVQGIDGTHQAVDGRLGAVPNVGGRRYRVLQLVFVLLELGLILLDLLERLGHALDRRHDGLREISSVDDRNRRV